MSQPYTYEPLYDSPRRQQERKKWDVFENPPIVEEVGSMEQTKWLDLGEKLGKILSYVLTFIIILGGAVLSKGTYVFMAAQLNAEQRPYCNQELDRNKNFRFKLPRTERIGWMWMIMFAFFVPQVGTFIRSARKLIYKSWKKPKPFIFIAVFLSESLMTIGIAIFTFVVLPNLDSVKALMLTNAMCFIPAIFVFLRNLLRKLQNIDFRNDPSSIPVLLLDLLSTLAQASAFLVWPIIQDNNILWFIVAAAVLISCGWWENFAPLNDEFKKMIRFENSRYFIYAFVSIWKCAVFFASMVAIEWISQGEIIHIFDEFSTAFEGHSFNVTESTPQIRTDASILADIIDTGGVATITSYGLAPVWVFLINVLSTYLCYITAKWVCKINIQGFSYSFPINLTIPVALTILIAMCGFYMADECAYAHIIPEYIFFIPPSLFELNNFVSEQQSWIWLFWLLSQAWITRHTWIPKCEKLASTEKLFVRPMYEPFFIDQDLAMNRRVDDGTDWRDEELEDDFADNMEDIRLKPLDFATPHPDDSITRVYACATMWHETKDEMMEFLKSIFRLDEDQCARRTVREELGFNLPDYYELETHIFFDDSFVRISQDDTDPLVNDWVRQLVSSIDEAASVVHEVNIRLRPPKKIITPYGGRLIWTLPGKTKMIAHLKDKKKIRAKKRWSQVMYMYYLLGHKLMERKDISSDRKDVISENTFILALDGDIDFQPKAVHLLVELMKKNKNLGAACGRIHPIGSGPLVWYQMFEYAVGHWMQKATEHVIGCVLCSPGCFSLFRGKALMDDGVMAKYTTKSSEARHYVQYDQGEDRWLCTLLLQRGYRVEYAAASDAFTHCPEGFSEFYNQRRRWMPSTTANILDLLMSSKRTVEINDNISTGYILYQFLLLFGTVLGPGTIFLMLVGAFVAVFQWSQWTSFLWNVIPLSVFIVTCSLFTGDNIQLFVAGVLSGVYSLVMMAVVIGIVLQTTSDGWLAPSSLFFFAMIGGYVITAFLHPKELRCLKYGLVYYVTIPSMYMLLVIYSVFNMNNVSWGTREVTIVQKPENNANSSASAPKEEKKSKNWIISWCGAKPEETSGSIVFSLAGLFRCVWCTNLDADENNQLAEINKRLVAIQERLEEMEKSHEIEEPDYRSSRKTVSSLMAGGVRMGLGAEAADDLHIMRGRTSDVQSIPDTDIIENSWLEDDVLRRGEVEFLFNEEEEFWNGVIDKYLHPIDDTKNKDRIAQELKSLRDKMVLAFFMINALFVLVIFLLTLNRDQINFQWPFGYSVNFTYLDDINMIWIEKEYLELEPIGIVFLFLFASLICIQFVGMLFHRFQTFTQIVANTAVNLSIWNTRAEKLTEDELLERNPVEVAKKLQKLKGVDDEKESAPVLQPARRKTVAWLDQRSARGRETINDLDTAFQRRTGKIIGNRDYRGNVRRETVIAIQRRRSTFVRPSALNGLDMQNGRNSRLFDIDSESSRNSRLGPRGQPNLGFVDDSTI